MQVSIKHSGTVDIGRKPARGGVTGAENTNNRFSRSFNTDLFGYFTITDYTELELYKLTVADSLSLLP